jgi:hypothetical protein
MALLKVMHASDYPRENFLFAYSKYLKHGCMYTIHPSHDKLIIQKIIVQGSIALFSMAGYYQLNIEPLLSETF